MTWTVPTGSWASAAVPREAATACVSPQLFNTPNMSRSAYRAHVDPKKCVACGKCVEVCLESREEMPAVKDEIREVEEEGIQLLNGWGQRKFPAACSRTAYEKTAVRCVYTCGSVNLKTASL